MTLSPTTWDAYVGQPAAKARLRVLLDAALLARRPLDHLLLAAPGTGLGALARILAAEIGGEPLRVVPRPFDAEQIAHMLAAPGILLFEGLETASTALQAKLATLMEAGYFPGPRGPVVPPWTTILATSDDPRKIAADLFGRFVVPSWEPYTPAELDQIVRQMVERAGLEVSEDVVDGMAAAASTPRHARLLVLTAVDLGLSMGAPVPLDAILDQCGLSADGLTEDHLRLLVTLDLLDGSASMGTLSKALGRPEQVCMDLDSLLRARRLVDLGRSGREITPAGVSRARRYRHRTEDGCLCGATGGRCNLAA